MSDRRARIFDLIEKADNFVKYARAGEEARAYTRARKKLEKAALIAEVQKDDEMLAQVRLRLTDLDRRSALPPGVAEADGDDGPIVIASSAPEYAPERIPPGQRVTRGWPVLHEGPIPRFDPATWRFTVTGACAHEVSLSYEELKALPTVVMRSDFHCVTGWSKLDNLWTGVHAKAVLDRAQPTPEASHVVVHAEYGYTANLPLAALYDEDVLLTWGHDGKDLARRHGFPLRLVVPKVYGWKSVKWVRSFELTTEDRRGFWEIRGYHNRADPWREERYSYQE
jgi:DMSO/TMAO reductase YedYZ molybdopterin-dependent catalytic subunit